MTAEGGTGRRPVRTTRSLLLNVSTLLQEPIGSLRRFEVDCARVPGLRTDVSGSLRLLRTDQSVLVSASLTTSVADLCGGCLEEITIDVELAFDEEFWPQADAITGFLLEPPPERAGFDVIDSQIDLSEAVRQYVELHRPMSPRCGADCPGLDRATPTAPAPDPRWAALAALTSETEGD